MAEIVRMPKLSDTMTEGVVAAWHKKVGDEVESGELLAEIETDKATMDFESFQDGILLHIGVETGATAPVDSILCVLGEKGEDIKRILADAEKDVVITDTASVPAPSAAPVPVAIAAPVAVSAPAAPVPVTHAAPAPLATNARVIASPLAKKLADKLGLSLDRIPGSGEGGRVVKRDVENFKMAGATGMPVMTQEKFTEVGVSQMRKTIARRLAESKFTAPHFYLSISIDMSNAMQARKAINDQGLYKVSFNDMVVKATAVALRKHPAVNSSWLEDRIRYNEHVNIGVAVAVEDGLLVPVVRFADGKSFATIGEEVRDFAGRAKAKTLQPADWEGSTFTISNLGMFGIENFTAIINPPDACILAIGGISNVPVVKNDEVVPGHVMKVTLSCDHRVVDGATGASFLQEFKNLLENPVLMLV
ncbi:MAG: pyruvate dehydrogenase complex dihydrolipoamide acetyltransferase [Flavobacteriales bacterium]|jgi:pyruvate dehydrogenase E2 component (dihydrolipoamide acetyltransferase)|nr:pyruvate dehydrogenase complex dihydrolipoamide acetyltransferase [Bacteroidota bacterium]MDA0979790.1 pyruvate dehydrogenase complex dihydrolipoamide acetyltransferase [Bacteroidota bacterium]|tara:strand:+ start:301 stop:1560 length:1260 start_codon:yes stop_codon:yes gene_type:complete